MLASRLKGIATMTEMFSTLGSWNWLISASS